MKASTRKTQRAFSFALLTTFLTSSTLIATPAFAALVSPRESISITKASKTPAPAAVANFVEELNRLNERAATDSSLDLVTVNNLYSKLWKKAASTSVLLSIPQKSDTPSTRRAAKFPTYAAILSVKHRGVSYCVVADKYVATEKAPAKPWTQSLLRGSCSKYFKVVTL
jgi:hypothetical protein